MVDIKKILLQKTSLLTPASIHITGSKSESNRALILNALSGDKITIRNLSEARDTRIMKALLSSNDKVLDVLDAGTTMRFLTAYCSIANQNRILTGSERMKQRPLGLLVDALRKIGAKVSYLEKEGYPPIEIHRSMVQKSNEIQIRGDVSSQYISALLMIAPMLANGLSVELMGNIGSRPYIEMTLALMEQVGIHYTWEDHRISIDHQTFSPGELTIEPDWSGASYWYSFAALAETAELRIPGLQKDSLQGDHIINDLARQLGVSSQFRDGEVILSKCNPAQNIEFDFKNNPDLVQTVSVVCAAKNIHGRFTGLESLRIKETDRIAALQQELNKLNASLIDNGNDSYQLVPSSNLPDSATIETYDDHRMAMSFAPLCTRLDVDIINPEVVDKSYPSFWEEVSKLGVKMDVPT